VSALPWWVLVTLAGLSLALVLCVVRLVRGPSLPDRVVAIELMSTLSAGIVGTYAIGTGEASFIRVAAVVALVSFLGTVAFARFLQREPRP
jgi:multicomponent Na+:H+ antiporter subunit F